MRKIAIILTILSLSFTASSQTLNPFPTTDSLRKFINKWIRNSPVDAFTNLRLNSSLLGMTRFIDSAYGGQVTGFTYSDDTIRLSLLSGQVLKVALPASAGNTNLGSGFRLLVPSSQGIKTIFAGNTVLIDSTSNTDALTFKVDTTVIATLYDITLKTDVSRFLDSCAALRAAIGSGGGGTPGGSSGQIQYNNAGAFAGGPIWDNAQKRLTSDTLLANLVRTDSVKLARHFFTYMPTGLEGRGDSFMFGSNASPRTDSGFIYRFGSYMNLPVSNQALSGTGCFYNIKNFHANVGLANTQFQLINVGFNDLRVTGDNPKTYAKNVNAYKAAFVNHFASVYVDAGGTGVTRSGTWTTGVNATLHAGKSANAAYTSTLNDTITYAFSGTSVAAVMMGSDGIVSNYATFDVLVDNVLYATYNANNQTDGAVIFANPNHTDSVFTFPVLIHGLGNGNHTLKLVNKSAGQRMFVDYFTTLASPSTKPPLGVYHLIPVTPYYITNNAKIDSMVATLPSGYPFAVFEIEDLWVTATDLDLDNVHPNNSGHRHYFETMAALFSPILPNLPDGLITFQDWLYVSDNGVSKQLPYTEDVWTKNNDNINFAGSISLPASKIFRINQGSTLLLNYDPVLKNVRLAGAGNNTMTGSGNFLAMPNAGLNLTSGSGGIHIGESACLSCTTAGGVSLGAFTNAFTTTGLNIAIGPGAVQFAAGTANVGIGTAALQGNVSTPFTKSTAVGDGAGQQNRADNNIYYGAGSGFGNQITGTKVYIMGYNAGIPFPSENNFMNINNIIWGRGTSGQGNTQSLGQIGIRTYYVGRNTLRIAGSVGIEKDSIPVVSSLSTQDIMLIDTTSGADSGTLKRMKAAYFATQSALQDSTSAIRSASAAANNQIVIGTGSGITSSSAYSVEDDGSGGYTLKVGTATSSNRGNLQLGNTNGSGTNVVDFVGSGLLQATANIGQLAATGFSHNWFLGGLASQRMKLDHGGLRVMTRLKVDTVTTGAADDSLLVIDNGEVKAIPNTQSQWIKVTKAYTDFVAASTTDNIAIYSLPAGAVLHAAIMKHSASFTGGSIATYTLSLGTGTGPTDFIPASNVFQAAAGNVIFSPSTALVPKAYNMGATTGIFLYATTTGGNVNTATQGSVDIWLLISTLP